MNRFADSRAEQAYADGFVAGVPKDVAPKAGWLMHLLLAAHDWQDVRFFSKIGRSATRPGRYGLPVSGKWFVTFAWEPAFGAAEIRLERW